MTISVVSQDGFCSMESVSLKLFFLNFDKRVFQEMSNKARTSNIVFFFKQTAYLGFKRCSLSLY